MNRKPTDRLVPKLQALRDLLDGDVFCGRGRSAAALLHLRAPFVLEALVFSTFVFVAAQFVEPARIERKTKPSFTEALRRSALLQDHPQRLDLQLLLAAVCFGGMQTALWYYQPLFDLYGVAIGWNGIIFFACHMIAAGFARSSLWLERRAGGYPRVLFAPVIAVVAAYFVLGASSASWSLAALVLFNVSRGWNGSAAQQLS